MKPIRRDFVFNQRCEKCNSKLSSNIAVILRGDDGVEKSYGPACARKLLGQPVGSIPNLTTAAILGKLSAKPTPPVEKKTPGLPTNVTRKTADFVRREKATTYLILRMHLLRFLPGVYYHPLEEAYEQYRSDVLTAAQIDHILRIEQINVHKNPQYSLANLVTVYAFSCALKAAIPHVVFSDRGMLWEKRKHLHTRLFLSSIEVQKVAKCIKHIPNHPPLDANGFCWAWGDKGEEEEHAG